MFSTQEMAFMESGSGLALEGSGTVNGKQTAKTSRPSKRGRWVSKQEASTLEGVSVKAIEGRIQAKRYRTRLVSRKLEVYLPGGSATHSPVSAAAAPAPQAVPAPMLASQPTSEPVPPPLTEPTRPPERPKSKVSNHEAIFQGMEAILKVESIGEPDLRSMLLKLLSART
jgi:hypothetical protein